MLKYTFIKEGKTWAVIGPPEEMCLGLVHVRRSNGEMKPETIIKLTEPFDTPEGPRQLGFVAPLPQRRKKTKLTDRPQRFPVTVRKAQP